MTLGQRASRPYPGLCVRNDGERAASTLELDAFAIRDTEVACTGSEGEVDPEGETCGSTGEASSILRANAVSAPTCEVPVVGGEATEQVLIGDDVALPLGTPLAPGESRCFLIQLQQVSEVNDALVAAQSDAVTWRWRVTASE
jgi:hypothetical protein